MSTLELTLVYLLAAVLGVVACRSLKLPPMLGYLVVGVVIGPNALALGQNSDGVRYLGEFGVVFLMFVIGLEFNLPKLRAMRAHVFGLGLMQVVLTIVDRHGGQPGAGRACPRSGAWTGARRWPCRARWR
jgi:CPA2 family monovalent cation:H+ antiporter-2